MAKRRVKNPAWAERLCRTFEKRYGMSRIMLTWYESGRVHEYRGWYRYNHTIDITVNPNVDMDVRKRILLHELAHAVMRTRYGANEGHSVRFYKFLWRQYRKYDIDLTRAFRAESEYMKNSVRAYKAVFKGEPLPVSKPTEDSIETETSFVEVQSTIEGRKAYDVYVGKEHVGTVQSYGSGVRCVDGKYHDPPVRWRGETFNGKVCYSKTRKACAFDMYEWATN